MENNKERFDTYNRDWCEDGTCLIDNFSCSYSGSCNTCPIQKDSMRK